VRLALTTALVFVALLAGAALAPAKEDARARLTTVLPLAAAPATTIRVGWAVDVPDGNGGRKPFNAGSMFVRLLSRTGAASTTAFTGSAAHPAGRYVASVRVPAGGIGGIRMGLRATVSSPNGTHSSDLIFPLDNDPFTSRGGARCDAAALRTKLTAFVRAYNNGDFGTLDALFSRKHFAWYSSGGPGVRVLGAAKARATLIAYFRQRHGLGDRLRLRSYRFNGYEAQRQVGHFALSLSRRADDFLRGRWSRVAAKGALDCARPSITFAVLSLGAAR
jgi:hypothetical protein